MELDIFVAFTKWYMQVDLSVQTKEGTLHEWDGLKQNVSQQGPETITELKKYNVGYEEN